MPKNLAKEMVLRNYEFEVRAETNVENESIVVGRPIVYNSRTNLGWFDEIIERGALDNADLTDVRFLVNHDTSKIPLARSRRNNENSTMQLTVDANGMTIRVTLDTENNSEARNLYSAIKRGDITGMSFMFGIDDQEWTEMESDHPTRHIRKISTVIEVSAVTFPAYEETDISARNKEALDSARRELDNARNAVDTAKETRDALELEKAKNINRLKGVI